MESRLPDINSAFNHHRQKIDVYTQKGMYIQAVKAVSALNGLLPKDEDARGLRKYQVIVSDAIYKDQSKTSKVIICRNCPPKENGEPAEVNYSNVKFYNGLIDPLDKFVRGVRSVKCWCCPECGKPSELKAEDVIIEQLAPPHFKGVVPMPPNRDDADTASAYHTKFNKWLALVVPEIEAGAARYRDDNWKRSDADAQAQLDIIDGGEETGGGETA